MYPNFLYPEPKPSKKVEASEVFMVNEVFSYISKTEIKLYVLNPLLELGTVMLMLSLSSKKGAGFNIN